MLRRWITILAHKFDWHYAPVHGPFEDGRYQRWCQWCGLRESYSYDPRKPIQRILRSVSVEPEEGK